MYAQKELGTLLRVEFNNANELLEGVLVRVHCSTQQQ